MAVSIESQSLEIHMASIFERSVRSTKKYFVPQTEIAIRTFARIASHFERAGDEKLDS